MTSRRNAPPAAVPLQAIRVQDVGSLSIPRKPKKSFKLVLNAKQLSKASPRL
jgi:hypothetical protein